MATPRKPASSSGAKRTGTASAAAAQRQEQETSSTTTTAESAAVDPSSTTAGAADPPAAAIPASAAGAASSTPTPSTSDPPRPMPPVPPMPPSTTLYAQLLELLQSSQHQTKMVHSAGTALGVWMTLWITWYLLVVAWTYSSGTGGEVRPVDINEELQRTIAELEKLNDKLQIHLDEHHLAIENVRDRRIELQPLRERFMSLRQHASDSRLVDSGSDEQDKEEEEGRTKTSVVDVSSFPRLHDLVTHLRRRLQDRGVQDDSRIDDASTAVVRELFFMARNELYLHTQQDSVSSMSTMSTYNYTIVNSLLQSYTDLSTNWYEVLPIPKNCRSATATDNSDATATTSWTPSDIEAWISSNTEVQDKLVLVQQLLDDRVGINDREWKVALEDTYDRVQQRYMEVASTTNARIFQHMKDLQQHLDHWEVREAQKGSSTAASYEAAATPNNQCAQPSQVLHWIDVALDAHYRNRSVHEAVLTALRLDANVPPSLVDLAESELAVDSTRRPHLPSQHRRRFPPSLRLLLDTPLLHQTESWIDQFVEYLEGRHDTVDAFVDGLAARAAAAAAAAATNTADGGPAPGSAGDAASIGHYVVQSLLTGVGRVVDDNLLQPWRNDDDKSKSTSPAF